ncbi:MAG TPA: helix-turn-helix domain-containing protein [Acidimicrobiia bacterium]|nr:helix-turn-helix domain-containing protein [Acidimicrobiia bacterium]
MAVKNEHPGRRTQAERSAATRGALLAAARELFARDGYAATGREAIAERAGVTRGALYHHFSDKEGLFRAVFDQIEAEVMAQVAEAAMADPALAGDPLGQLRVGALAYLDSALDPAVQRICLIDAPAVLSPAARQAVVDAYAVGLMREVLAEAVDSGAVRGQPIEPLTHVLLAALHEAAFYVARAADQAAARDEVGATIEALLDGLRAPAAPNPA